MRLLNHFSLSPTRALRAAVAAATLALVTFGAWYFVLKETRLLAQSDLNCSSPNLIDATTPTGARWEMCWEHRFNEGIVLRDITFTPPGGPRRKVLGQANLAQIHVPYDDNAVRFHDLSDFGLGDVRMAALAPEDCPNGTLLAYNGKPVLCQQQQPRGYAYKHPDSQLQAYVLSLFSVSHVGAYNYISMWKFYDDGAIEPQIGATGKLQRLGDNPAFGWPLRDNVYGISHTHNYYWRLDFDLAGAENDLVEEIEFTPVNANTQYVISVTPLATEAARPVEPTRMRSWRVRDTVVTNSDNHPISYQLDPLRSGHRHLGPDTEPFTYNEFYVTAYKPCEQWASHNPTADGCGDNLAAFVDGESTASDVVVWYGISFHHLTRDEDETYMDVHWDGFQLLPRDWNATNPLDSVSIAQTPRPTNTPVPTNTPAPTSTPTQTPVPPTPTATATFTPPPPTVTPAVACFVYSSSDATQDLSIGASSATSYLVVPDSIKVSDIRLHVRMAHSWTGDVSMVLAHEPSGRAVMAMDRPGVPASYWGCNRDDIDVILDDEAASPVESQCATTRPTTYGRFRPNGPLATFQGIDGQGRWLLTLLDASPAVDQGTLQKWSIQICTAYAGGQAGQPVGSNDPFDLGDVVPVPVDHDGSPPRPDGPVQTYELFFPAIMRR